MNREYILAQGPLDKTCGHFWQMVWEQETKGIIMLNRTIEKGMRKCHQYWPNGEEDEGDDQVTFQDFQITLLSKDHNDSYNTSRLKLEHIQKGESREVLHFHYLRWPDFGVPQHSEMFLDFLAGVRNAGILSTDVGPCVIHCSAGIGRSGTFCLVDTCLEAIHLAGNTNTVDIPRMLLNMRRQRMGLIQTPDQLRFSYQAIMDGVLYLLNMEEPEGQGDVSYSESESGKEDEEPPPIPPRDPDLTGPAKDDVIETGKEKENEEENEEEKVLKRMKSVPEEEPPHKREKLETSGEGTGEASGEVTKEIQNGESEGSSEWELINGAEELQVEEQQEEKEADEEATEKTDERESVLRPRKREERKRETTEKIEEIKKKMQKQEESWWEWVRPYIPFGIAVTIGVGFLLYKLIYAD